MVGGQMEVERPVGGRRSCIARPIVSGAPPQWLPRARLRGGIEIAENLCNALAQGDLKIQGIARICEVPQGS
jgi:hypothetical protein